MTRLVQGPDGREWVVRGTMEWRQPATAEDFDHDVAGSYAPGIAMALVVIALAVALLVWMPKSVVVPSWIPLALLLLVIFFPLRWVWRRPWTIVAHTEGTLSGERPGEHWVGTVRGLHSVRGEVNRVAKSIQRHDLPDFEGPLHPVQ